MPHLSVIMPVYNAGPALRRALSSTLAGMPRDSRLIALDDGSTDDSVDVLSEVAARNPKLTVMTNDTNVGVARTLNRLLDVCDSTFVARMDADDIMLPWRLRLQQRQLGDRRDETVFSTVLRFVPDQHKVWPQRTEVLTERAAPLVLLLTNPFVHSTMFARTETLRSLGGYREVPSEDYDLWMRMVLDGRAVRKTALPTIAYRHHSGQVTLTAGWMASARYNEMTANTHAELSRRELGWDVPVFGALRGGLTSAEDVSTLTAYVDAVDAQATKVGQEQCKPLNRQIAVWRRKLSAATLSNQAGA